MLFTRQKERADANPECTARNHPEKNIREVRTPSRTVFKQKQNKLFIEKVLQCSQDVEGDELNCFVLGLNESSTEEDTKKAYRSMSLQFHPDKNIHEDASKVMWMINEAKEGLEDTLHNNYVFR